MDEEKQIQVMAPSAVEAIERAEIDVQIATAKRFPRPKSLKILEEQILQDAAGDEVTAAEMYYTLKRRTKDGLTVEIKGPSVRLSEICAFRFQNLHIAGRVIDHDHIHRTITAQAVAWDLESNNRRTAELTENITIGSSDGAKITRLAAIAKAERDAIFKVVPRAIWIKVVDRCINKSVGDLGTLRIRVSNAVKTFAKFNVQPAQILAAFGLDSFDNFSQSDLGTLLGMHNAIKEGTSTIDEIFSKTSPAQSQPANIGGDQSAPQHPAADNGVPAVSGAPSPANDYARQDIAVNVSNFPKAESAEPAEPPTRRGRPPGSKNKPRETTNVQTPAPEKEEDESPFDDKKAGKPVVQTEVKGSESPAVDSGSENEGLSKVPPDPKSETIADIRKKLEASGKTESRLMAKLHEWKYTENPASGLEDIDYNDLRMIGLRWTMMVMHL